MLLSFHVIMFYLLHIGANFRSGDGQRSTFVEKQGDAKPSFEGRAKDLKEFAKVFPRGIPQTAQLSAEYRGTVLLGCSFARAGKRGTGTERAERSEASEAVLMST